MTGLVLCVGTHLSIDRQSPYSNMQRAPAVNTQMPRDGAIRKKKLVCLSLTMKTSSVDSCGDRSIL